MKFRTEADDSAFLKEQIRLMINNHKLEIVRAREVIDVMESTIESLQDILDTLKRLNTHGE